MIERPELELGCKAAVAIMEAAGIALWRVTRPLLVAAAQIAFALVVMFEEWGWQPIAQAMAALGRIPLLAALERGITRLPPYGALAVFAVPGLLLIPVKLLAVYLFASGDYVQGLTLLITAKVVSTALVARIFHLTQPTLMQIAWFKSAHDWFVPWKEAMFAWIRASWAWRAGRFVKVAVKRGGQKLWRLARGRFPRLGEALWVRVRLVRERLTQRGGPVL
jgi:hypothetical protein